MPCLVKDLTASEAMSENGGARKPTHSQNSRNNHIAIRKLRLRPPYVFANLQPYFSCSRNHLRIKRCRSVRQMHVLYLNELVRPVIEIECEFCHNPQDERF